MVGGLAGTKPSSRFLKKEQQRERQGDWSRTAASLHPSYILLSSPCFPHIPPSSSTYKLRFACLQAFAGHDRCDCLFFLSSSFFRLQPITRSSCSGILCSVFASLHLFRIQRASVENTGLSAAEWVKAPLKALSKHQLFIVSHHSNFLCSSCLCVFFATRWAAGSKCQHLAQRSRKKSTTFITKTVGKSVLKKNTILI